MPYADPRQEAANKKAYYAKNKERLKEYQAIHYLKHKDRRNAQARQWASKNSDWVTQRNKRQYEERRAMVWRAKAGPCADCGVQYPPYVMQFDHRDPTAKAFIISHMPYKKLATATELVHAEIAKCDLVCANCHAKRTWQQLQAKKKRPCYGAVYM